jgi:predicted enzyme related to lactoylglutathione lyase
MRSFLRTIVLTAAAATLVFGQSAAPSNAVRMSKYILTVDNFEKSWAFYHALGVEFDGPGELRKPGPGAGVKALTNTPDGTTFRAQLFRIPGAEFALEFTEFTNLERHALKPRMQDPGAAVLILRVRDLDTAVKAALSNGGEMVTLGGKPFMLGPNKDLKVVFVKDPDGFYVELQQPKEVPSTLSRNNIVGAEFASVVDDAAKAAEFYKDKFGFQSKVFDWTSGEAELKLSGLTKGQMQRSLLTLPGSAFSWEFIAFKGVDRKPVTTRVPDPGAAAFAMIVRDIDSAGAAFKSANGSIYSAGGEIIHRPNGSGSAFMRDPSGNLIEVLQNAPGNAVRLSKYILTVSDLDKTYAFYHDALGINLDGNATEIRKPQKGSPANQITGSPADSSFRNANTRIPGSEFVFEFIELTGQPRTPHQPRIQDPGASVLVLTVRDVDAALAAVKKAGAKVITAGGGPLPLREGQKTRAVFVTDPDGFFVELMQFDPAPKSTAPEGSMVLGARWGTLVEDAVKSASFYRDRFGFDATFLPTVSGGNFLTMVGLDKGSLKIATIQVPGRQEVWEFFEFQGMDRAPVKFNVPDPGSLQLGFQVRDIDAAAAAYKAGGGAIVSTGGEIIRRPNGGGVALIRDPNGVYLEVAPAPKQ